MAQKLTNIKKYMEIQIFLIKNFPKDSFKHLKFSAKTLENFLPHVISYSKVKNYGYEN